MIKTYKVLDVDTNPDGKALDSEAMLDAEIRIRLDEDGDIRPHFDSALATDGV